VASSSLDVISFEEPHLALVPEPVFPAPQQILYEDDSQSGSSFNDIASPPPVNRRRATNVVVAPTTSEDDEGDFILRREIDFGLRRNVPLSSDSSSQRTRNSDTSSAGESGVRVNSEGGLESGEPVLAQSADGSRRTGLPTTRRVLARQRENQEAATIEQGDLNSRRREERPSVEVATADNDGSFAAARQSLPSRQRLRQEVTRTTVAPATVEEEPSSRAASPSIRARAQLQRSRPVLPPESPVALVLPRSGHSAKVDEVASNGGEQVKQQGNFRVTNVSNNKKKKCFESRSDVNAAPKRHICSSVLLETISIRYLAHMNLFFQQKYHSMLANRGSMFYENY
jgi:hypothetical protein